MKPYFKIKEMPEVYDRYFWDTLLTCNFSIYKKDTCKL